MGIASWSVVEGTTGGLSGGNRVMVAGGIHKNEWTGSKEEAYLSLTQLTHILVLTASGFKWWRQCQDVYVEKTEWACRREMLYMLRERESARAASLDNNANVSKCWHLKGDKVHLLPSMWLFDAS